MQENKKKLSFNKSIELDPKFKETVILYFLETQSVSKTAKFFKTATSSIYKLLNKENIYHPTKKQTIAELCAQDLQLKEKIISFYLFPHSLNETCKEFNLGHRNRLKKFLIANNVSLHSEKVKNYLAELNKNKSLKSLYGTTDLYSISELRDNFIQKIKQTKRERYGDENFNNANKIHATVKDRYNCDNVFQLKKIKDKSRNTCQKKYNCNYYAQTVESRIKHKEYWQAISADEKTAIYKKMKDTRLKKYGVKYYAQTIDFHKQSQHKYFYNNEVFDSLPELAVYLYAIDHKINIKREPLRIKYIFNGEDHYYFPDFLYDNQLIEIKGEQFFDKETDKMICPFDRTLDALFEAKHQCRLQNNINIWRQPDYQFAIDYFNSKYKKENFEIK